MADKIVFGDVARRFLSEFIDNHHPCSRIKGVITNLSQCRTEEMGRCSYHCWDCEHEGAFNLSCRNRHCPSCHTHRKEQWIEARRRELLPVQYFHVVFTLPDILNQSMMGHMEGAYNALFKAASDTLKEFGEGKKVKLGMTMVLHTWGSNMSYHPHLHVLVPGGGTHIETGKWVNLQPVKPEKEAETTSEECGNPDSYEWEGGRHPFLFPVKGMSEMFRAKFFECLTDMCGKDVVDRETRKECFEKGFVVYAKAPATGPEQVLEYLARYSYGIAISNSRIIRIDGENVIFKYKDYRDGGKSKEMTLDGVEFLRRFSMHILPKEFTRIRHYGLLAPSNRERLIKIQGELENLLKDAIMRAKQREKNSHLHALRCENCHGQHLHISIGPKNKRIRSPSSLGCAV